MVHGLGLGFDLVSLVQLSLVTVKLWFWNFGFDHELFHDMTHDS